MTVAGITLGTQQNDTCIFSPSQDLRHCRLEIRCSHVTGKAAISLRQRLVWRVELATAVSAQTLLPFIAYA